MNGVTMEGDKDTSKGSKSDFKFVSTNLIQTENLSKIYVTLIHSNLVPSTPLELTLLVELLNIKDSDTTQDKQNTINLSLPAACREFAVRSLRKLKRILKNLPLQLLSAFIAYPPVQENLPRLTKVLSSRLEERRSSLIDIESKFCGSTQPFLALPFDQKRDSRHNYRYREELVLYKNREESRDAFLYQLRHFQNVRGKVLDTAQLESSLFRIRKSAQKMIQDILVPNMHWFAQFFFDLLLQIGLVPMEETDKELLKITNKDKLKKLHERFSSKVGSSKGSSTRVLTDFQHCQYPENEVFQYFPGHQEFFLLFIQAVDSHHFCMHLKSRLIAGIEKISEKNEVKDLSERLPKMQLLAKFLGAIVFSPNWHSSGVANILKSVSANETHIWTAAAQLQIPLYEKVNKAENEMRLLELIPWILSLLQMIRWDYFSMQSQHIQLIITKLLSIQERIQNEPSPNLQIVSWCLESFFHKIIGLRRTRSMPVLTGSDSKTSLCRSQHVLDFLELQLPDNILFNIIPHLDDFATLLSSTVKTKQTGTLRKMRPSFVSTTPVSTSLAEISSTTTTAKSSSQNIVKSGFGSGDNKSVNGKSRIQQKLVEFFFHQHKDLKEICEFVVDRALKKGLHELEEGILTERLKAIKFKSSDTDEASILPSIEQDMIPNCLEVVKSSVTNTIKQSLDALSVHTKPKKVKEIATTLAVTHAMKIGTTRALSLIKSSLKKEYDIQMRKLKKISRLNQT